MRAFIFVASFLTPLLASAQLTVSVLPPKVSHQKAIVPLLMKNGFEEKIESARAVVFLLDEQGKMLGQSTRWIIGGNKENPGLPAKTTNVFNFVITADKPLTATNLTTKVSFSRVLVASGKSLDIKKDVIVVTR